MVRALKLAVVLALLSLPAGPAAGQRATERYIPIGQSPGLSARATSIGTVTEARPSERTFVVATPAGSRRVLVSDATRIWLDRSRLGLSTVEADVTDCREGRPVEIRFEAPDADWAEWIKVGPTAPGP